MKKDDRILNEFIEAINRKFGPLLKKIILFGSRARGDHEADSDYDCRRSRRTKRTNKIKEGIFPKDFSKIISRLFRERQVGDYISKFVD
jgi:predicted nucleotidyltransferase